MDQEHEYRFVGERELLETPLFEAGGDPVEVAEEAESWLPDDTGDHVTGVKVAPRPVLSVEEAWKAVQDAARAGDFAGKMEGRANLIKAIYMGRVAGKPPFAQGEVKVKSGDQKQVKARKTVPLKGANASYIPLGPGELECAEVAGDVLGYTGEEYRGRKVVAFRKHPEVFGGVPMKREAVVRLTLHKGILNHMELRAGQEVPTPYWAVMDAASELKGGFTTEEVLIRALAILGDDSKLDACRIAWYVLKSHHTHPKERYRGMSYMVEEAGDGKMGVRGRRAGEAVECQPKSRAGRTGAVVGDAGDGKEEREVPIVTHVVSKVR